jgi:hypothetical protein
MDKGKRLNNNKNEKEEFSPKKLSTKFGLSKFIIFNIIINIFSVFLIFYFILSAKNN